MAQVRADVMKVAAVGKAKGGLELVDRDIPEPGPGEALVRVEACGVCHSDALTMEGQWPGIRYPRAPGHEIAGVIEAVGDGVTMWKAGARVGVGWHGGHDGACEACRRGRFVNCANLKIPGISYDGGYAEYVAVPVEALAALPEAIPFEEAAPLLCAGVTTFNALRHTGARAGDLVAIQGIGGLGHLGVQFASRMGFKTAAIGRGRDKEPLARQLGAHVYIDSEAGDPGQALAKLGGARVILATAPSAKAMSPLIPGLGLEGELVVVGASPETLQASAFDLIGMTRTVRGWPSGSSIDSEDALRFCALTGIRPMIETFPRRQAAAAYERMITGKVRFRSVIVR